MYKEEQSPGILIFFFFFFKMAEGRKPFKNVNRRQMPQVLPALLPAPLLGLWIHVRLYLEQRQILLGVERFSPLL